MMRPRILLALLAGLATLGAGEAALTGTWGSEDSALVVGPAGGRLQFRCTLVSFGPVRPDAAGHFTVPATTATVSMRPPDESADETVAQSAETRPASLAGTVNGDGLNLTLTASGEAPQTLSLLPGQHARPQRCL
jgi:hypothetical protein